MPRRQPPDKRIDGLIHDEAWEEVKPLIESCHPADIADIIDRAPHHAHQKIFSLLPDEIKPDVLAELETVAESDVLDSLSVDEISDIVEEMAPDDAADVLGELPAERSRKILDLMEEEESEDVRKLLKYDDETAGGIMTPDVVAMHENQTVGEALEAIAYLDVDEQFLYAYIVDETDKLIGYADIWELLRERDRQKMLDALVHRDFIAVPVDMDQEKVASQMNKYNLSAIPVVDNAGKLVGRVTTDDVIDVMEEEASEDIFRLAGSDDAELERPSILKSCFVRLPWLFITLLGGFVTAFILNKFIACTENITIAVLICFVPVMLAMGGNTGIQSSTLMVRSIALGDLKGRNVFSLLLREIMLGAMMGSICGVIIGTGAHFFFAATLEEINPLISPFHLSITVTLALFSGMTFATTFGTMVPIVLNKMRIDPAVASGPFVTITNDISSLLIYFGVTILLIHKLVEL
ncbi:magnesium transporter [Verrucomicrobiota bacterium]